MRSFNLNETGGRGPISIEDRDVLNLLTYLNPTFAALSAGHSSAGASFHPPQQATAKDGRSGELPSSLTAAAKAKAVKKLRRDRIEVKKLRHSKPPVMVKNGTSWFPEDPTSLKLWRSKSFGATSHSWRKTIRCRSGELPSSL